MTDADAGHDSLIRFLLPKAGVRGVRVHLDATWQQIRERMTSCAGDKGPEAVAELLGEATAASALFTAHAKVEGRLSIQLRGEGPLRTLFAECTAAGTLRAIARVEGEMALPRDLRMLGAGGVLAVTIENPGTDGREPARYQGMVALDSDSLAGAFEHYFRQSEQLPTRLMLAASDACAAGLMLQKLPGDSGDEDGWDRALALFGTLSPDELLDWPAGALLTRLFHQESVEMLGVKPLRFACSCSRERVASMLQGLGREEAVAAAEGGSADIRCEFCGQQYHFDAGQVAGLFRPDGTGLAAPERLQ